MVLKRLVVLDPVLERAGSTNSWTNDIGLKVRIVGQWAKSLKRMWRDDLEVSGMEGDIADLEVVGI